MTKQAKKNRFGVTPAKLALVAVLVVVQVGVIVRAVRHRSESAAQAAPATLNTTTTRPATAQQPTTASPATAPVEDDEPSWPKVSLEEALKFNPFQKPRWLAAAMPATHDGAIQSSDALEQLKQQGASIVVVSSGGKAATIGDQRFRIGDVIDGYQVTDITVRGVEFTRLSPQ